MAHSYRLKCPKCQNVMDSTGPVICPQCQTPVDVNQGGLIRLYRMGSPIGIAVGFGIYINGQPCGHIGNKQSLLIPVPFGSYTLHVTAGMLRKCQDLSFTLTPQTPVACAKARIKPGFLTNSIVIEPADPSEMP